ncbi:hypothetical protein CBNA_2108 [Coxiella burnetii str. Namibia]|nr:hypothetical protein CBNA_2108 [Coxiella burnetii str. Namibia]
MSYIKRDHTALGDIAMKTFLKVGWVSRVFKRR